MLSFACARQLTRVYIRYYYTSIDTILGLVNMNVASIELQTESIVLLSVLPCCYQVYPCYVMIGTPITRQPQAACSY